MKTELNINQEDSMQPLCSWCNKIPAGKLLDHGLVSHGICQECAEKVKRELEISKLNAMWRAS